MKNAKVVLSSVIVCAMMWSCSSNVKKADIPSSADPQSEISKLETDLNTATAANIDVLAANDFNKSMDYWKKAKKDLADNDKQEKILEDVRTGKGYLEKAYSAAENRESKAPGLFESRQAALKAGAAKHPQLLEDLHELDSKVADKADKLDKLSAEKISQLQANYSNLERRATVLTQLGTAQASLNGAKKDGAARKAPETYKKTELSVKTAETMISSNVRNPESYQKALSEANNDASLLLDVMNTIKDNGGKGLSEPAALKMVMQNRKIKGLNTDLHASEQSEAMTEAQLQAKNQELNRQNKALASSEASVTVQQVLENARSQFSSEEAEAYQQGKNLLIRLKTVNFASGRSDLPASSLPLLAKVSEVAKSLNAKEIKVEGHTDSVGPETTNKALSEKRAAAVASYFKANGFSTIDIESEGVGFSKPIATNKSKEGRAQNRRVDIIITPEGTASVKE